MKYDLLTFGPARVHGRSGAASLRSNDRDTWVIIAPDRPTAERERRLGRLLEVGRSLVSELELDAVLERVLEAGRDLTGAQYAAIGVLDEHRTALESFITLGIDEETHRAIGDLPRGRGVLGVLITDPILCGSRMSGDIRSRSASHPGTHR